MASKHTCLDTFWGQNEVVNALVLMLNNISTGGALSMSEATYYTLCALQREIECAIGQQGPEIPGHVVGRSPWSEQEEACLRAAAQAFMAELVKDHYDATSTWHDTVNPPNWLNSNGLAETNPYSAVEALQGGPNGPPIVVPDGLWTRVRNALGN